MDWGQGTWIEELFVHRLQMIVFAGVVVQAGTYVR